jgi:hypothetical protein
MSDYASGLRPTDFARYTKAASGPPDVAPPQRSEVWSGIRESNPHLKLGKLAYYHCTNPAGENVKTRTA